MDFTTPLNKIQSFYAVTDEQLAMSDVLTGASCDIDHIRVFLKQVGVSGAKNPSSVTNTSANINIGVWGS